MKGGAFRPAKVSGLTNLFCQKSIFDGIRVDKGMKGAPLFLVKYIICDNSLLL